MINYSFDGRQVMQLAEEDVELAMLLLIDAPTERRRITKQFHVETGSLPKAIAIVDCAAKRVASLRSSN